MRELTKKEKKIIDGERKAREILEKKKQRESYLNTLGLTNDILISQSSLKDIFPDSIIKKHFPRPHATALNPNLSKSYQRNNPKFAMKLYLMATVIEKIKEGVKPRVKASLKEEYKKILLPTLLNLELPIKEEVRKSRKV